MYPRGNHWAVGHLMGKKSIKSLPEQQQVNLDYLTFLQSDKIFDKDQTVEDLSSKIKRQTILRKLFHNNRKEDNRGKHPREMLDLLLAFKLKENESS
ncbi:hypothetical protein AMECASPLE_013112 [Ameca splendens]